jgi:hypothetical protein
MTPAQYYSTKVHYDDFSIDYFFMDTNVWDTWNENADPSHNICSKLHNPKVGATCGIQGPVSPHECPGWFRKLWDAEIAWLEKQLQVSKANWQIIIVHHPPESLWGGKTWNRLAPQYGIDMFISGHRHRQEVHYLSGQNSLAPTAYLVSGGGGGITAENEPKATGEDDEYGFMDLTLSAREIRVEAISHGGQIRSTTCVRQRAPGQMQVSPPVSPSLCDGIPPGPQPLPTKAPPAAVYPAGGATQGGLRGPVYPQAQPMAQPMATPAPTVVRGWPAVMMKLRAIFARFR